MNGGAVDMDTLTAAQRTRRRLVAKLLREFYLAIEEARRSMTLPPGHPAFAHIRCQRVNIWLTEAESGALLLAARQWREEGNG